MTDGNDPASGGGTPPADSGDKKTTFTEADVQAAVEKAVRERTKEITTKHKAANAQLETRLQEALKGKLSATEREDLENQLEAVRAEGRTKEEAATERMARMEKEHKARLEATEKRATEAETRFRDTVIERALRDAALEGKPSTPAAARLIVRELLGTASIDDKGEVMVERTVKLEDGSTVKKAVTPAEAVALLEADVVNFGPLFESSLRSGLGADSGDGKTVDISRVSMAEYMKLRKTPEGQRKLGWDRQK